MERSGSISSRHAGRSLPGTMILAISSPISLATQGDDVARLQQALRALGRAIPDSELSPPTMGAGTVAILRAVQQDLGIPVTGVVDAGTVDAINKRLGNLTSVSHVVRGTVVDSNSAPAPGLTVSLFRQAPAAEVAIGSAVTDVNGAYTISYS